MNIDTSALRIDVGPRQRYVRLKAVSWAENGPLYPGTVRDGAGQLLSETIGADAELTVVNCSGIDHIENDVLAPILSFQVLKNVPLCFHGMKASVQREIIDQLGQAELGVARVGSSAVVTYNVPQQSSDEVQQMLHNAAEAERRHVVSIITDTFVPYGKPTRMKSTPLKATGEFDARLMLCRPAAFIWCSTIMEEHLETVIAHAITSDAVQTASGMRLLAVSLRGSAIAASLALLSGRQNALEIVDHIGPRQKLLEEHQLRTAREGADYIYIGDFLVGGTEIKVAQAYLRSKGSSLRGAVVLGSVLPPAEYEFPFLLSSVVDLRTLGVTVNYTL